MSDAMQVQHTGRPLRGERTKTSCGECRRRKQRCNQEQPCGNCARRFPQPLCEYNSSNRRNDTPPGSSSHQTSTVSLLPPPFAEEEHIPIDGVSRPLLPPPRGHSPVDNQLSWAGTPEVADSGEVVRWSGIDIETQFPSPASASPWPQDPWTSTTPGDSSSSSRFSPSGPPPPPPAVCEQHCTVHSEAMHDAMLLLRKQSAFPARYISQWQPGRTDEVLSWLTQNALAADPLDDLSHLPISPTRQNAELLRIFVTLISRFKAALDGRPDPNNPYIKVYLPFCIQTPMLAQIAIYTSAFFLQETGNIDKMTAMAHKGLAIRMLNEHLRFKGSTTDEAVAGVTQLIINEWYWGDTSDLRAHLAGLREMIRLRGGFRNLGMNGLLSKLVISSDVAIALSFETAPYLQSDGPEFEFHDAAQVPLRLALNTPLVSSLVPFSACADALNLHPATAQILDDMRFLIGLVLALPRDPSGKDLQKIKTTSSWVHERISSLPAHSPITTQRPAAAPPDLLSPDSAASPTFSFSRHPSPGSTAHSRKNSRQPSPQRQRQQQYHDAGSPSPSSSESKSKSNSPPAASHHHHSSSLPPAAPPPPPPPDMLYQAVRQAALLYARAIGQRRPLGEAVSGDESLRLWAAVWRVSLAEWRGLLGVFCWVVLCVAPRAGRGSGGHGRWVKSLLAGGLAQMAVEGWGAGAGAMGGGLGLQAWLAGGSGGGGGNVSGEGGKRRRGEEEEEKEEEEKESMVEGMGFVDPALGGEGSW